MPFKSRWNQPGYYYANPENNYYLTNEQAADFAEAGFDLDRVTLYEYNYNEWKRYEDTLSTLKSKNNQQILKDIDEEIIDLCNDNDEDCVFDFLDSMLSDFEQEVNTERRFIHETKYPLNKSGRVYVAVGLSPARGFYPSIRITGPKNTNVSFLHIEWNQIVKQKNRIAKHLLAPKKSRASKKRKFSDIEEGDDADKPIVNVFDLCDIFFGKRNKWRWIRIEKNGTKIVLNKPLFERLYNMLQLLEYRIKHLEELNFVTFYNDCLTEVASRPADNVENNDFDYLKVLLTSKFDQGDTTENIECILEAILYNKDKVIKDISSSRSFIESYMQPIIETI